jgi:ubiquinone/menaquinone biosynthesis C-methylase UbiE
MDRIRNTKDIIIKNLDYINGKTLDLGCGYGKYKEIIKTKAIEYVSLDKYNINAAIKADIHNTKLDDNSFDTIICTQVFEHIPDPFAAIKEIKRILKPGGVAIVTAPFSYPYHLDPKDYFRYTEQGLSSLFRNNDFEIVKNGKYGGVLAIIGSFFKEKFLREAKDNLFRTKIINALVTMLEKFDKYFKVEKFYSNTYVIGKKKYGNIQTR